MLGSITPLGERGRGARWGLTVGAYLVGGAVGGAAAGVVAGTLGLAVRAAAPPAGMLLLLAGAAALAGAALDAGLAATLPPRRLPGPRRQVNEEWLTRYRGWVYGVGFGFQLGLGVATIVTTAAVYSLVVVAALSGSPQAAGLIGATFGLGRALPVLAVGRVRSPETLLRVDRGLRRWQPASARFATLAQAATAALVITAAISR